MFTNNGTVIMFKKNLPLIFIATIFVSFDNQTKAMQESDVTPISEKTEPQQDIFHCKQEPCNTLKFIAASKWLAALKAHGINIFALDSDNEDHKRILENVPEELIEYCKKCPIFPLIHKHITDLKQFKGFYKDIKKITDESLDSYNILLHKLVSSIDIQDINMKEMLSELEEIFYSILSSITLKDINIVLRLLIELGNTEFEDYQISSLNMIWDNLACKNKKNLIKLLAKNKRLMPSLTHIFQDNHTFLLWLVRCNDINLFKSIINEERNKPYNWEELFSIRSTIGWAVLHFAVEESTDILEVLLELIKEKGLDINTQTNNVGLTPLMIAARNGDYEIVKLLIDHKANINLKCKSGKTASDYAILGKKRLLCRDNIDPERLKKVNRCIELLISNNINTTKIKNK